MKLLPNILYPSFNAIDGVHSLLSERGEVLFESESADECKQWLDSNNYHRIGDSITWHRRNVNSAYDG